MESGWLQVARFCESELSRMRLEERDKFQGELAKIRREVSGVIGRSVRVTGRSVWSQGGG